jgi:lon-related putative ATP-dependent protease
MDERRQQWELRPEQVCQRTDAELLGFATTADLPAPARLIGQARAEEAIDFALEIPDENYNLYVSGQPGSGRSTSVLKAVRSVAGTGQSGSDWCYVYHFDRPSEPWAIELPAGGGHTFAHAVAAFVEDCRRELRRTFGSEQYRQRRVETLKDVSARRTQLLDGLRREALAHGFFMENTEMGLALVPLKRAEESAPGSGGDTRRSAGGAVSADLLPLSPEEFEALPPQERERVSAEHDRIQEVIAQALPQVHAIDEEVRDRLRALNDDVAQHVIAHLADALLQPYATHARIVEYVRHMQADMVAHVDVLGADTDAAIMSRSDGAGMDGAPGEEPFGADQSGGDISAPAGPDGAGPSDDEGPRKRAAVTLLLRRYRVNALVARQERDHAPVVREIHPTYSNLLGRIEFGLRQGLPFTDHLMIQPGAFHQANGGYLILHARELFRQPLSWEAVKRVLRFGVIGIETGEELSSTPASASLRPEPIPARIKVILIGDPQTYAALTALDPEFPELFKVRADFDSDMPRTPEAERFYAQFAGDVARCAQGLALTSGAVALLIDEGSRWVEDRARLTAQLRDVLDLTLEACNLARKEGAALATRDHVARAITARERRARLVPDKLDDLIAQGTILIDTSGAVVGQVNGLTVMAVAGYAFGEPARITARTAPGLAGIVDIERETLMSGPAHSKGILVLSGYLSGRYAQEFPLSLSASICFEQIYGEIEGDSASSAELYALLSSLANVPIKQSLAVTGSVNQRGEVQAVGGVNQKIEGFFKLCSARGLRGDQGVVIPRANVRNLMLREEVVDAVRAGQFHVYAVSTIDEGIEMLTGMPAGEADQDGCYPDGTINGRVSCALRTFSEHVRTFGATPLPGGRGTSREHPTLPKR